MSGALHITSREDTEELSVSKEEGRLALDIFETDETIFVVAPLAGVESNEIEISVSEDVLTIRGVREFPNKLPDPKSFFTEECFWGPFSRSIVLPSAVNSAEIKAKMKKNVLVVAIPKAKKASKKIEIET